LRHTLVTSLSPNYTYTSYSLLTTSSHKPCEKPLAKTPKRLQKKIRYSIQPARPSNRNNRAVTRKGFLEATTKQKWAVEYWYKASEWAGPKMLRGYDTVARMRTKREKTVDR
ncbi:hypothetical protein LINGRAHAP2_LOCUS34079, partial [Linum grandiflorum]